MRRQLRLSLFVLLLVVPASFLRAEDFPPLADLRVHLIPLANADGYLWEKQRIFEFVKSMYLERDVISPTVDFNSLIDEKGLVTEKSIAIVLGDDRLERIGASIIARYSRDIRRTSLYKRLSRFLDFQDLAKITALSSLDADELILEIKGLAVDRRYPASNPLTILARPVQEYFWNEYVLRGLFGQEGLQVKEVIAETQPGAHSLIFKRFGLNEQVLLPDDKDFSDGRGVSIVFNSTTNFAAMLSKYIRREGYLPNSQSTGTNCLALLVGSMLKNDTPTPSLQD